MNKYIIAFDVESTGLSQKEDYIIQLSAIKFEKDTYNVIKTFNKYILPTNPTFVITSGAYEAHGLTKEFIEENGVPLKSVIGEFLEMWSDSDVLTFNGNRFDVNMLYNNLLGIGVNLPMEGKIFYDSYAMEARLDPRTLTNVYFKYTGMCMEDAHNSMADVEATVEVFKRQMEKILEEDTSGVPVEEWNENQLYSPEGSIRNAAQGNEEEYLVFNMGKYKDKEFMEVCRLDPQYISWFKDKVASPYTWRLLANYYRKHRNEQRG